MGKKYDIIIKSGHIIDGTGNPWYEADIGINGGKIISIGNINEKSGKSIIDATSLIVSPGFIDLHNHSDQSILSCPFCESNIMQGITTAVVGNCGLSMAPVSKKYLSDLQEYVHPFLLDKFDYGWEWFSLEEYYQKVEKKPISLNLVPLVGHGTIRIAVKGFSQKPATTSEIDKMKYLLRQSLHEGAFGMSTGLYYPPGYYSTTAELVELCNELKNFKRVYATHLRSEGRYLIEAVEEAIEIGKKNNVSVQISHHKAMGKSNWGKVAHTLRMLEHARSEGLEIGCDVYPYTVGSSTITSIFPTWVLEGGTSKMLERLKNDKIRKIIKKDFIEDTVRGDNDIKDVGFEGIFIASCKNKNYEGKSLMDIFKMKNKTREPFEAMFDLILELKGNATVNKILMNEQDMQMVLSHPLSAIISDSHSTSPYEGGNPHPRAYGTFPRVLGKYVREKKIMRLEEAIRKMTSYPASIMRIKDRGILHTGYWADIVIFNPDTISDCATYQDSHQYPLGIDYVIVNGKTTVGSDRLIKGGYGKVLRAVN